MVSFLFALELFGGCGGQCCDFRGSALFKSNNGQRRLALGTQTCFICSQPTCKPSFQPHSCARQIAFSGRCRDQSVERVSTLFVVRDVPSEIQKRGHDYGCLCEW